MLKSKAPFIKLLISLKSNCTRTFSQTLKTKQKIAQILQLVTNQSSIGFQVNKVSQRMQGALPQNARTFSFLIQGKR